MSYFEFRPSMPVGWGLKPIQSLMKIGFQKGGLGIKNVCAFEAQEGLLKI